MICQGADWAGPGWPGWPGAGDVETLDRLLPARLNTHSLVIGEMRASADVGGRPAEIDSSALAVWAEAGGDWTLVAYQPTPLRRA